jgi:hypothetical protein
MSWPSHLLHPSPEDRHNTPKAWTLLSSVSLAQVSVLDVVDHATLGKTNPGKNYRGCPT